MFRPRLRIRESGKIRDRIVPAGNTHVNLIRVWIENYGFGMRARECSVYLDSITFRDKIIENESSPLRWTDINNYEPQTVTWGKATMMPVDLCEVWESDGLLRVTSRKAQAGGLTRSLSGVYTFDTRTRALSPVSNDRVLVDVYYDSKGWKALKVIGFNTQRKWPRLWSL